MELFDEALIFAAQKHSGQRRKFGDAPYILHPMETAAIVGTMTDDPETLAAAVLHDTVEDAGVTFDELRERFGRRVALLVMTETEEKRADRPPEETWRLRKEETLTMLEHTRDRSVKMMWLGDKLSNMRSLVREYRRLGDAMWEGFHQKDPAEQAWYYRSVVRCLRELAGYDAYREYAELTEFLFRNVQEGVEE